ncbi:hypothetical protein K8T06_15565 [bacterium]|nr:hypothetical protein [bacterium]
MEQQSIGTITRDTEEKLIFEQALDNLFDKHDFSDILCDGRCTLCTQRDWCMLTPSARYVK